MSQCQDSGGLRACSGPAQASLLLPLPFSAHSPIVSYQGKLPRPEAWRVGLDGHTTPIPTPPQAWPAPSTGLPTKGQGSQIKIGWEGWPGPAWGEGHSWKTWVSGRSLVISLPPCGARDEAVLGLWFLFLREGGSESQDEMGEESETGWCFSQWNKGRVSFLHRKYKTEGEKRKREEGRLIWLCCERELFSPSSN